MKNNLPHKFYKIKVDLYNFSFFVVISEDYNKSLRSIGDNHTDKTHSSAFVYSNDTIEQLMVFIKKDTAVEILVHETVHIVNRVFDWRGIRLDLNNDEPQAYLTAYIFKEIQKVLIKHNK